MSQPHDKDKRPAAVNRAKALQAAESQRVKSIISSDKAEREREDARQLAELEVGRGIYVNLDQSVTEPTPEWLAKGETEEFTPKQHDNTVRSVSTRRRVQNLVIKTLHTKGRLTDEQLAACLWYRDMHEAAGMNGRWPAVRYGEISTGGGDGNSPMPMHEYEAWCREHFRAARERIDPFYRIFFDNVVVHNIPAKRAGARCRANRAATRFQQVVERIVEYCRQSKIGLVANYEEKNIYTDQSCVRLLIEGD